MKRDYETQKIGDTTCEVCGCDCTLTRPFRGTWDAEKQRFVWVCVEHFNEETE